MSCDHKPIILSVKKGPHIWACSSCKKYVPNPHPNLSAQEVEALIEYAVDLASRGFIDEPRKKEKKKRNEDLDLL